jgi:hypothetical protein
MINENINLIEAVYLRRQWRHHSTLNKSYACSAVNSTVDDMPNYVEKELD